MNKKLPSIEYKDTDISEDIGLNIESNINTSASQIKISQRSINSSGNLTAIVANQSGEQQSSFNDESEFTVFTSTDTPGFEGRYYSSLIHISWNDDARASGYNVYKQGNYYTTVIDNSYIDLSVNVDSPIYQIIAFDESNRFFNIAKDLIVTADTSENSSSTSPGFTGKYLTDVVHLKWKEDTRANGYNIYRQGNYYTTVFDNQFFDTDIVENSYEYEIVAFDGNDGYFKTAENLTVFIDPSSSNNTSSGTNTTQNEIINSSTPGFYGQFIDGTIQISWDDDARAQGYNVYRQDNYYTTVFDTQFIDTNILSDEYEYEIIAFDYDDNFFTIATGLVVPTDASGKVDTNTNTNFTSETTSNFNGNVVGDTVQISWENDARARGYNVYRQDVYYTTVFDTHFTDTDLENGQYTYEIIAFDHNENFFTIATDLSVSISSPSDEVSDIHIASSEASGFKGQVQENSIRIEWNPHARARGYNVYRQGHYIDTVFTAEYSDTGLSAGNYSYEIIAFDNNDNFFTVATELSLSVTTDSDNNSGSDDSGTYIETSPTTQPNNQTDESEPAIAAAENENPDTDSTNSSSEQEKESIGNTNFSSVTTPGFNGEVLEDSIRISWNADPDARGYNVYRQADYYTTVFDTQFFDTDVYDGDYYYEIQAFDYDDKLYYIATGLTVSATTFGTTDPNAPQPNDKLLADYELVFSDEFTSSTLDTSKWNTSFLWGTDIVINREEQYYVDIKNDPDFGYNPFNLNGDHLTIQTIPTPPELTSKARNQPYLSGIITSYDAFKFTYGYVETRAKMTHGRGYWPAFWLLNAYYIGAKPEIDIMEFIGSNQDVMYHTYHYFDENGKLRSTESFPVTGIDFTADFHTFGVEWMPGKLIFYVDGIATRTLVDPNVSSQQMYVLANQAVGGWWAGSPDSETPFPGNYVIDYIRVYQRTTPYDNLQFDQTSNQIPLSGRSIETSPPNKRPPVLQWSGKPN